MGGACLLRFLLPREHGLSQAFVEGNGDGIGKVVAAGVSAGHGNGPKPVGVQRIEMRGQAMALVAEDQPVAPLKPAIVYASGSLCGAEEKAFRQSVDIQKLLPVVIDMQVQVLPVVHAGPPQVRLVQQEAQGPYEMEARVRADA